MQKLRQFIKKHFGRWWYRQQIATSQKTAIEKWIATLEQQPPKELSAASFNIFTYHGEDGILAWLISQLKDVPAFFVDIGAGDCIKSNCATLAVHFNWSGLFIDQDKDQLAVGKIFYKAIKHDQLDFIDTEVDATNANGLLEKHVNGRPVGLLSIDIDGNDFWVWKSISNIKPSIVIIEAKVEFGHHSIAVPAGAHNHHSTDAMYNGASVEALRKLGEEKGYILVGANKQGYNLFFIRKEYGWKNEEIATILADPETIKSIYPSSFFESHVFEHI